MSDWLSVFCLLIGNMAFAARRLLRYLRYLQQEEYSGKRFIVWVFRQKAFDRKGGTVALTAALLIFLGIPSFIISPLAMIALLLIAYLEDDPRLQGKLRLKMTERATRIFFLSFILYCVLLLITTGSLAEYPIDLWITNAGVFQIIPLCLVCACGLLSWEEKKRQLAYIKEAKQILSRVSPFVIGITGSYGKTSTKDVLGHLLQVTLGPTFWPPKGINTVMGNTREIRFNLQKGVKYAIFEMGAYGEGSIQKLCELTPPSAGIITSIGTAHLERFKSEESIYKAKSELARAIPSHGILVCNGDNPGARKIAQQNPKEKTLLYGFDREAGPLDCWISSSHTLSNGTAFTLHWQGKEYEGFIPLFGKTSLSNAVGAFTLACALGSHPLFALAVIHHLSPVDNRLQVQREGSITFIRDAYNSNSTGFSAALDVMCELPGKRRILMTPGIIELGSQQYPQNEKIGHKAAQICNHAIIVGRTNQAALFKGLKNGGMSDKNIIFSQTREQAFKALQALLQDDDIVLIENDLPDLYEVQERF